MTYKFTELANSLTKEMKAYLNDLNNKPSNLDETFLKIKKKIEETISEIKKNKHEMLLIIYQKDFLEFSNIVEAIFTSAAVIYKLQAIEYNKANELKELLKQCVELYTIFRFTIRQEFLSTYNLRENYPIVHAAELGCPEIFRDFLLIHAEGQYILSAKRDFQIAICINRGPFLAKILPKMIKNNELSLIFLGNYLYFLEQEDWKDILHYAANENSPPFCDFLRCIQKHQLNLIQLDNKGLLQLLDQLYNYHCCPEQAINFDFKKFESLADNDNNNSSKPEDYFQFISDSEKHRITYQMFQLLKNFSGESNEETEILELANNGFDKDAVFFVEKTPFNFLMMAYGIQSNAVVLKFKKFSSKLIKLFTTENNLVLAQFGVYINNRIHQCLTQMVTSGYYNKFSDFSKEQNTYFDEIMFPSLEQGWLTDTKRILLSNFFQYYNKLTLESDISKLKDFKRRLKAAFMKLPLGLDIYLFIKNRKYLSVPALTDLLAGYLDNKQFVPILKNEGKLWYFGLSKCDNPVRWASDGYSNLLRLGFIILGTPFSSKDSINLSNTLLLLCLLDSTHFTAICSSSGHYLGELCNKNSILQIYSGSFKITNIETTTKIINKYHIVVEPGVILPETTLSALYSMSNKFRAIFLNSNIDTKTLKTLCEDFFKRDDVFNKSTVVSQFETYLLEKKQKLEENLKGQSSLLVVSIFNSNPNPNPTETTAEVQAPGV